MAPPRIIDMHHHLPAGDARAYARQLAAVAEACRIRKVVLAGIEWTNQHSYGRNADVLKCRRECPDKIVFGSDVSATRIPNVIADYRHVAETLQWPEEQLDNVFYRTAAAILAQAGVGLEDA